MQYINKECIINSTSKKSKFYSKKKYFILASSIGNVETWKIPCLVGKEFIFRISFLFSVFILFLF